MPATTQEPISEEFIRLADPFRAELLALCYRMLGSIHEAEDAVQETYLRAWRSYAGFEGRSSLRTWLHRIAVRACLRSLERADRRPLPSGLGSPSTDPEGPVGARTSDVPWLQPFPSAPAGESDDPAAIIEGNASLRLALIAALQLLSPRRRAVLLLRDVLDWRAAEVAAFLGTTTTAVNSLLQHARAQLKRQCPAATQTAAPLNAHQRDLLERYARAFENADIAALTRVLTEDAVWEMPPIPTWFAGRGDVVRFLATRLRAPGGNRLIRTAANGQPAFAVYARGRHDAFHAHALHVLTVTETGVTQIVAFMDTEVFAAFGLPPALDSTGP